MRFGTLAAWMAILGAGALAGCESGCRNTVLERSPSPDGRWDAVAFVRGCGATTRPTANVSLVRSGRGLPDDPGNLVLVDEPAAMAEKKGDLALAWPARDTLVITYRKGRNLVRRAAAHGGVAVLYREQ